jgi:deoxyribodipyrimidine photolyase-related protein
MKVLLVLPDQLFWPPPAAVSKENDEVWLLYEDHYRTEFDYCEHKRRLHERSLAAHAARLSEAGYQARGPQKGSLEAALRRAAERAAEVHMWVPASVLRWAPAWPRLPDWPVAEAQMRWHDPPNFLLSQSEADGEAEAARGQSRASQFAFYKRLRRRLAPWLQTKKGGPRGGEWSLDAANRSGPGSAGPADRERLGRRQPPKWPATRREALALLRRFVDCHLCHFGEFQDAVFEEAPARTVADHSLLSSSLNLGLLTPGEALGRVEKAWKALDEGERRRALPSVEGFVRQLVGWREFMRVVYLANREQRKKGWRPRFAEKQGAAGEREQRRWYVAVRAQQAGRADPASAEDFPVEGGTEIAAVDRAAADLAASGYLHHIRRLMVVGLGMLVRGLPGEAAYRWFMELSVDGYEWVMWPNVYGMVYWALAPNPTGRPYLATSRYHRRQDATFTASDAERWDRELQRFVGRSDNRELLKGIHPAVSSVVKAACKP